MEAVDDYQAAMATPALAERANRGLARALTLVALRQRELGMTDDGYMARAREAAARPGVDPSFAATLDILDVMPWRLSDLRPISDDDALQQQQKMWQNRETWQRQLEPAPGAEPFDAYAWLAFMCGSSQARVLGREPTEAAVAAWNGIALIEYRKATCLGIDSKKLAPIAGADPRFEEIDYFCAVAFILEGKLDEADAALKRAYAWHPRWPAVTLSIGNVAMTAEDFAASLASYNDTLTLAPGQRDALLGRTRALTYLGQNEDAIAAADVMLRGRWYRGEALYWRAFNETTLNRLDAAWADVEDASRLLITADVAKLAGIIAYKRKALDVARGKFEEARRMVPNDCETGFYLGSVLADQRAWQPAATVFVETATCLDDARRSLEQEIDRVRASNLAPDRKARQIAKREQQIAAAERMKATSWFNTAVAYYSISRIAEAREYAEKVADDSQFGERARELIVRLKDK